MGIVDAFSKEDRVEVKFSDFYNLIKESIKAELLTNGINCETPHAYMREMMTGKREEDAHSNSVRTIHIVAETEQDQDPFEDADKAGAEDQAESEG
ncbi:MAG: hypothetical protein J1E01_01300 [Acetatifactor sp.]|nr:hypothetical protein [Acetatifactor sp.]